MKALIFENKVVDVQEKEFDVAPTMTWVDCDDTVKIGFAYENKKFINLVEPTTEEAEAGKKQVEDRQNLKISAKTKLMNGEALTEEEANLAVRL